MKELACLGLTIVNEDFFPLLDIPCRNNLQHQTMATFSFYFANGLRQPFVTDFVPFCPSILCIRLPSFTTWVISSLSLAAMIDEDSICVGAEQEARVLVSKTIIQEELPIFRLRIKCRHTEAVMKNADVEEIKQIDKIQ